MSTHFQGTTVCCPPEAPRILCCFSALTRSNCSRSPRQWSRPGRFRRSSPHKGASLRRRRSSYGRRASRTALPAVLLPPSLPRFCRRRFPGGAIRSWRLFPTPQQEQGLATPPSAGGVPLPLPLPALATLQAPPLWDGVAFYWLTWGGGPTLANGRREASAEAWERGRTPGSPESRAGGDLQRRGAGAGARAHGTGVSGAGSWGLGPPVQATRSPAEFLP